MEYFKLLRKPSPIVTARIRNIKLDIGDKHDIWKYLFVPDEDYIKIPDHIINRDKDYWFSHQKSNDNRSNSLNPNNITFKESRNNHANQLNPNSEFKSK